MHHHHCHSTPAHHHHRHHHHHHNHHHHTPCSPEPDPPFPRQQGLWPAFSPSMVPRSCSSSSSSSSSSRNTDVSCTVHVDVPPSTAAAAPLLEPKPGDDGAAPTAPLPAILFGVAFWAIFAWIVYSYWF